jgi:asparagine synthase (glutamine-hydrolysing)
LLLLTLEGEQTVGAGTEMCGIAGIWNLESGSPNEDLLRRATRTLTHRGPDAEGYWFHKGLGFGHRRLSIIDPTGSPQPMTVGPLTITFNGEIFNYRELRADLVSFGHQFVETGDTEVIVAQLLRSGPMGVTELNGQFAFAIFDSRSEELWLYRDRLGVMPLYYSFDGKRFIFGSEIKAVLVASQKTPEVDPASIREYFSYRSVPVPNTLFKGVKKVAPGHWLRISRDGAIKSGAYWSLPTEASDESISAEDAVGMVADALDDAVASRMVADVPVGALLSGGVDSSLIVATASKLLGGAEIDTYVAAFSSPGNYLRQMADEREPAKLVANLFPTKHHEIIVPPSDLRNLWQKLSWHRDGPVSEPADVAVFRIAEKARERVKVLLSGEGADELFAGYDKYASNKRVAMLDFLPTAIRQFVLKPLRHRVVLAAMAAEPGVERERAWRAPFFPDDLDRLFGGNERHNYNEIWDRTNGDYTQHQLYYDCHTWLVDNLLERGDRMAMAASIEFRPPFLDHRLVELAFRLPTKHKYSGGTTKWVEKEVARQVLPAEIIDRSKVGFFVPMNEWFKGELREYTQDLLMSPQSLTRSFMPVSELSAILENHFSGKVNEQRRLWVLMSLEVWHQTFFGPDAKATFS